MLKGTVGQGFGPAGQVDLAIFANDLAGLIDEDRGVVAVLYSSFDDQFSIAQIKPDPQLGGLVKQGLRGGRGHGGFVVAVKLGLILDHPAREKGGQRHFGKDHQLGPAPMRFAHHL